MGGTQFAELSAFVAVAEHRNFTKAAAQLGVSPSTLSQTIRSFEERLGVRLYIGSLLVLSEPSPDAGPIACIY